jgi:hypothetical protein
VQVTPPTISIKSAATVMAKHVDAKHPDTVIESMIDTGHTIAEYAERIHSTASKIMANQMATPMANKKAARDAASKLFGNAADKIDRQRASVEALIEKLTAETMPKAPADAVAALAHGEVRAALSRMPQDKRAAAVTQAISDGDDSFVAAAVLGNPALTGLGKAERDVLREQWRQQRHGQTVDRIGRLKGALDQLDRLAGMFGGWAGGLFDESNAGIKAAERSAELAAEAIAQARAE